MKMLRYCFQSDLIFTLSIMILVNYCTSQKTIIIQLEYSPKYKCESLLKKCSCNCLSADSYLAHIVCKNMTDFSNFSQILDETFGSKTEYNIIFTDVNFFPARTLQSLKIDTLILDSPDLTVDENVFEEISSLKRCVVQRSGIKTIPDFRIIKDSIEVINIDSSRLTSLKGSYLQNLPLVWNLSFTYNSIRFVDPDVFKGTKNVETLDLSHNLLMSLPPKLLDPMKKLSTFVASCNNLLHVDNLFSVTHPKTIRLAFNNITDIDSVLPSHMVEVETFALSGNPIRILPRHGIHQNIPMVRHLFLDLCELQELNVKLYEQLFYLETLDLSYNLIEDISVIDLYEYSAFKPSEYVYFDGKRLYLNGNKLQSLRNFPEYFQFTYAEIAGNQIEHLTDEDFRNFTGVANLTLQKNKIQRIDSNTFQPIKYYLNYLDLSFNLITALNGSVRYLTRLRLLNLTHNSLKSFAIGEFIGLNELTELCLQHNQIKSLGQLYHLPQLRYLGIAHNDIEYIRPDEVPRTLIFIHLADNPFKCDCSNLPFILWLNASGSPATDIDLCSQSDSVNKFRKKSNCPEMCSCECTNYEDVSFISVDCSSKNLSILPQFLRNNFMQMEANVTIMSVYRHPLLMDQNMYPSLSIKDRVLGINLENNNLDSLEEVQLPPNLIQLYLANNRLTRLPESIFDSLQNLKQVSLSGNPWECDCNALNFKKWLTSNYAIIQDINNTRCGISDKGDPNLQERLIWRLTDLDICATNVKLIVFVSFGILILLTFCLTTKILYTKYELNIKVFLYFHGFTFVKEEDLDHDKIFDAFLSFSHDDDEFVTKEIISEIENKNPNICLCIHYRHFRPGEFIQNNIMFAVQNSKKTVLILTRNFLKSDWCLMEFRAAHVQALEDKVHRIIVVKIGDLPKAIDPQIQVYLDSTTYLTWGEKHFWNKLLYVLPTSSSIRNFALRNIGSNESD